MKSAFLILGLTILVSQLPAQKIPSQTAVNLNSSKSNAYRAFYQTNLLTSTKAQSLLTELEKNKPADVAAMKTWLAANFKRLGIDATSIKQTFIFANRQFEDCTICKKNCKGRCVQDPGSDCVCISHSEPNLKISKAIIFFSSSIIDETAAIELVAKKMEEKSPMAK
jgi:hypothetical protein